MAGVKTPIDVNRESCACALRTTVRNVRRLDFRVIKIGSDLIDRCSQKKGV